MRWDIKRQQDKLNEKNCKRKKIFLVIMKIIYFLKYCHLKRLTVYLLYIQERVTVTAKQKLSKAIRYIEKEYKFKKKLERGRQYRQSIVIIRKYAKRALLRRRRNRKKHASNIIYNFLSAKSKMNDFTKIISTFSYKVRVLQIFIKKWYKRIRTKLYILYKIWDEYEGPMLKKYFLAHDIDFRSKINSKEQYIFYEIYNKIKKEMIRKFFYNIRVEHYIKSKAEKKYENNSATSKDIHDIFMSDDISIIKKISKKLVTKPKCINQKLPIFTCSRRKIGGIRDYIEKSIILTDYEIIKKEDNLKIQ